MQRRPDQAGAAPAEPIHEKGAGRPADCAGEAGEQGNAGDRIAGIAAVKAGDGGKRRFIKPEAHTDADHCPGEREADDAGRRRQQHQAGCEYQIGAGQDVTPAITIDHPACRGAK